LKYKEITVIGKGIYTIPEAARLVKVSSQRITRWIAGYSRGGISYPPPWESELQIKDEEQFDLISFADLMEAKVIAAFYEHGVQIQTVRKAIDRAKESFQIERPFSSEKFETDGKRIFIDLRDTCSEDTGFMDVVSTQTAFKEIIQPTFKNIEFENSTAVRWWPLGTNKSIVVDPSRALGKPIANTSSVPVDTLIDALDMKPGEKPSKQEVKRIARLFDVDTTVVADAAEFNLQYAA